jgi:hypothetical protein
MKQDAVESLDRSAVASVGEALGPDAHGQEGNGLVDGATPLTLHSFSGQKEYIGSKGSRGGNFLGSFLITISLLKAQGRSDAPAVLGVPMLENVSVYVFQLRGRKNIIYMHTKNLHNVN